MARWSAAGACAVALSGALVISGAAQGLLTIFQPRQFSPVAVTSSDIRSLAGLATYGNVTGVPTLSVRPAANAAAASAYAGVTVLVPADLPAAVPATPRYAVIPGSVVSFTFDAAKAAAAAGSRGATLPPMPAGIDGTTLTLSVPPGLIESYGADITSLLRGGPAALAQPALVILEARIPSLTSTGATAAQLEDYLLAQPGIPPGLAAEIRAVGNPSSTLPVPIPLDRARAQQVTIAGMPALLIGDSTGIASLVLWQRSGVVYAVAGSLTSDQLLAVAGPPVQRGAGHAEAPGQRPHVQPLPGGEGVHGGREDLGRDPRGRPRSPRQDHAGVVVAQSRALRCRSHQPAARFSAASTSRTSSSVR